MWVTDKDGASADHVVSTGATSLVDVYAASFQAPIKDNERNIAKYGNVVPVKVATQELLLRCDRHDPSPPHHDRRWKCRRHRTGRHPVIVAESVSNADTGTQMRVNGGGYIYNFTTKNLTQGQDYTIRIRRRQHDRPDHPASPVPAQEVSQPIGRTPSAREDRFRGTGLLLSGLELGVRAPSDRRTGSAAATGTPRGPAAGRGRPCGRAG